MQELRNTGRRNPNQHLKSLTQALFIWFLLALLTALIWTLSFLAIDLICYQLGFSIFAQFIIPLTVATLLSATIVLTLWRKLY
ncbi:MAG: hypothetical protein R2684_04150 [Pyrinomonadaceae bacterium]